MIRFLTLFSFFGCAEFNLDSSEPNGGVSDTGVFDGDLSLQPIRLDVYAESATDLGLLNQSFFVNAQDTEDMRLNLKAPITVRGSLQGFQTFPTADIQVPGASIPVSGQLRSFVPNSLMSYAVQTDDSGEFSFQAIPSEDYTLAWIPDADVNLPFEIEESVPLLDDTVLKKTLSYTESHAVFGRIKDQSGLGIPDLHVQVFDTPSGLSNSDRVTNEMGAFNTRLYPGDYTLHISGSDENALPTIEKRLQIGENDTAEVEAEIQLGALDTINADGRVLDANGTALGNVLVRFTATSLEDHPSLAFTTQSTTGSNGRYSIPVLPGTYSVSFIPSHDGASSPVLIEKVELNSNVTELDRVQLPARPVVNGRLLDAFGMAAEGAIVRAQEKGFNGAVFETFTEELGVFSLAVSEGPLDWTFVPARPSQGAITFSESRSSALDGEEFQLKEGQLVSGCIQHGDGDVIFAPVEVRKQNDLLYASTFTDENGCFSVRVDLSDSD